MQTEPRSWVAPVVLLAGHAIKHTIASSFYIILPEIQTGLGLSNTAVGIMATARSSVGSISNLPAGYMADRFSSSWALVLALSLVGLGVCQALMGTLQGYWPILVASTIAGGATSFWHPAAVAALSYSYAERRGLAIALHGTGGSIGEALGPIICGALLLALGWQTILQLNLFPALLTAAGMMVLLRGLRSPDHAGTFADYLRSLRVLARNGPLIVLLVAMAGYSATQGAMITFLPIYLRNDLHHSSIETASFMFAANVAGIVSQPFMGLLSDRYGRKRVLFPCLLALAAGVFAVRIAPTGWPLLVAITLMGAFQFPLVSLFLANAMDIVQSRVQGTTTSLVYGSSFLFSSLSPWVAGVLADNYGVPAVFLYAAAIALVTAALLLVPARPKAAVPHASD